LSDLADPVPALTTPAGTTGEASLPPPIATVLGQPYHELPQDLFIPPDALEVFLDTFEGPLDLLLYLIRRQQLDILNLPILQITAQYMEYVDLMQGLNLELAAEYLLMAAWLAEIKSRLLLPKAPELEDEEEGEDPRVTLIRRLQEYERYKLGAERVNALPRVEREIFVAAAMAPDFGALKPLAPDVSLTDGGDPRHALPGPDPAPGAGAAGRGGAHGGAGDLPGPAGAVQGAIDLDLAGGAPGPHPFCPGQSGERGGA